MASAYVEDRAGRRRRLRRQIGCVAAALAPCVLAGVWVRRVVAGFPPTVPHLHVYAIAADAGGVYVCDADAEGATVWRVSRAGRLTRFAGDGTPGDSPDGRVARSTHLWGPRGVACGPAGEVYVMEGYDPRVRRIGPDGLLATPFAVGVRAGDRDPVECIGADANGGLLVCSDRIRRVYRSGAVSTIAKARRLSPEGIAGDTKGNVYLAESSDNKVYRVDTAGKSADLCPADG